MADKPTRAELKKYQRVKDEKEKVDAPKNDLMVAPTKNPAPYIKRALILLNGDGKDESAEKFRTITVMGRGKTVGQVVQIAEIVKRRVKGLHQITRMENTTVVDHYKPKPAHADEKLEELSFKRVVGGLHITLSLDELDTSDSGYQPPIPESEVTEQDEDYRPPRRKKANKEKKTPASRGNGNAQSGRGGRGATGRGRGGGRGSTASRGGASRGRGK